MIKTPCPSDYRKGDEDDPRSPYYEGPDEQPDDDFIEPDEPVEIDCDINDFN